MQVEELGQKVSDSRQAIEAIDPPGYPARKINVSWMDPSYTQVLDKEYIQDELGMFPVQEFTTMISEVLEQFIHGELGIKVGEFFRGDIKAPVVQNSEGEVDADAVEAFIDENVQVIEAFIKVVQKIPTLQQDIICLSLGIPGRERAWAKERMAEPPHRGGFTVAEGSDILIWFIRQNAELVRETVVGKARDLVAEFQLHVLRSEEYELDSKGRAQRKESSSDSTEKDSEPMDEIPTPPTSSPGGMPSSISSTPTPVSV